MSSNPVKDVKRSSNALSTFIQPPWPACIPTATQKHLKKYLLQFWRGKARGRSSGGGPGFSVPTPETSIEAHSIPWLSDTGAPLKGQAGSAGNGTENFHSAQSPPTSAAFLVKAVGNAARNHGSPSGQP